TPEPEPVIALITPLGILASFIHLMNAKGESGASEGNFATTVHPDANAPPTFQARSSIG
ncbi:unnamed protein product, partial [marine sediment metagenome]